MRHSTDPGAKFAHPASFSGRTDTKGSFPMDKADFHLHLVLRSRMSGATPPFRHTPSWRAERQVDFVTSVYIYYIYI
jgi:hypothetical protein